MILGNAKDVYNELYQWVALAIFACIVLVPAVQSLTAQAAVVTASGREQRFAVLRLLGVSAQQITRMTVAETALYSLIGIAAGLFGYACLLPALTYVEFQGEQIRIHEVLLPWWGYLAVAGVLLVIAVGSAWFAMQRVRIDPLGVAKRAVPAAVRGWQAVIGVGLAVITLLALRSVELTPEMGMSLGILMPAIVMIAVVYLIAPFAVQLSAKVVALLPGSARYVAVQRVAANPKLAWRRVAVSAFLGWIIGFLVASPIGDSATCYRGFRYLGDGQYQHPI
ncbi:hypothetical protein C3B44_03420 [Corynebacterium yudongzhengii]|uniref:ABC transporter permease n=1 Tax=Corynebacterium yudongzhengii TaxID=2080740 RepID=A0A2U1T7E0_9CORY|nr:FtsX-like permease family protein [Corynebacterium yudongzhengii]AWB81520.1 hypothetical protein C3B44_03420 [Corynebacterium yudongzhengii]PWC01909.1 ABC transporter permease [Corynebacterium yudongzhengii]